MEEVSTITEIENDNLLRHKKLCELKEKEWTEGHKKLIAIIGHDIKSPMSSIVSFLGLLKDELYKMSRSEIERNIDMALSATSKTYSLLDNLLQWALVENIGKSYQPEFIDFDTLVNEEIENVDMILTQKGININSKVLPSEKVFADMVMLKSVVRNLLNNAIKFSHRDSEITVFANRYNNHLEITIKDYGIGIHEDRLGKILDVSKHSSTNGTNNESGNGFGLLVCQEFIEINNGKLWIVSKHGEGSEFKFTLPINHS